MKCKRGDLAFIKKAVRRENIGRVIECVKYLGYYSRLDKITINGEEWYAADTGDYWLIEGNIETMYGIAKQSHIPDHWLSPIEPLPPEDADETDTPLVNDLDLVH
jgi:hypothetical protein